MSKFNKGTIQAWLPTILGIIIVLLIGGGILTWQSFKISKEKVKMPTETPSREIEVTPKEVKEIEVTPKEIIEAVGPSAVWNTNKCWPECIAELKRCETLDCISRVMEQYGASLDARNFTTKLLSKRGYLFKFQEMGKIDLGIVEFTDRVNTNEAYYLLNGSPTLVSTEIPDLVSYDLNGDTELENAIKKDPLYSEMKEKYPNIWFLAYSAQFIEKKILTDNNERFIFAYKFVNGCRVCNTEYSARIGFDFDSRGKFLKTTFLQIVKEPITPRQ